MTLSTTVPTVLLVDDEPDIRLLARIYLERAGFSVVGEADDGGKALARYSELGPPPEPTVVLLDHRMPGRTGLEVAEEILGRHPDQLIVLFSAQLDDTTRSRADEIGVTACVSKTDIRQLPTIIRSLVD